jgi:hypothetical protein
VAAILNIRGHKPDTSNTLMILIYKHVVLTTPLPLPPEGLPLLIEEELRPPSRGNPIRVSRNITRAVQVAALFPNINKMIIMGRLPQTTIRDMARKKSSHTMGKPHPHPPITPSPANTEQQLTRQEQAATKPLEVTQATMSLRPTMVAIVGNIKRATLSVPKPHMQTPTNNVVKPNTPQAVKTKDATGRAAFQGVPLTTRTALFRNAPMAIKNLVPATQQERMGIGTKAPMEH